MGWLLSLFTGGAVTDIVKQLTAAYAAKTSAVTDQDRIAADLEIARLTAIADVQKGEQWGWLTSLVRVGFALPFVVYVNKLVLWDKVLGWGATDPLGPDLTQVLLYVLGFFFLTSIVSILKK